MQKRSCVVPRRATNVKNICVTAVFAAIPCEKRKKIGKIDKYRVKYSFSVRKTVDTIVKRRYNTNNKIIR